MASAVGRCAVLASPPLPPPHPPSPPRRSPTPKVGRAARLADKPCAGLSHREKNLDIVLKNAEIKEGFRQVADDCMMYINFLNGVFPSGSQDGYSLDQSEIDIKFLESESQESRPKETTDATYGTPFLEKRETANTEKQRKRTTRFQVINSSKSTGFTKMTPKTSEKIRTTKSTTIEKIVSQNQRSNKKNAVNLSVFPRSDKVNKENIRRGGRSENMVFNLETKSKKPEISRPSQMQPDTSSDEEDSSEDETSETCLLKQNKQLINPFHINKSLHEQFKKKVQDKNMKETFDKRGWVLKEKTERKLISSENKTNVLKSEHKPKQVMFKSKDNKLVDFKKQGKKEKYAPTGFCTNVSSKKSTSSQIKKFSSKNLVKVTSREQGSGVRAAKVNRGNNSVTPQTTRSPMISQGAGDCPARLTTTQRSSTKGTASSDVRSVPRRISRSIKIRSPQTHSSAPRPIYNRSVVRGNSLPSSSSRFTPIRPSPPLPDPSSPSQNDSSTDPLAPNRSLKTLTSSPGSLPRYSPNSSPSLTTPAFRRSSADLRIPNRSASNRTSVSSSSRYAPNHSTPAQFSTHRSNAVVTDRSASPRVAPILSTTISSDSIRLAKNVPERSLSTRSTAPHSAVNCSAVVHPKSQTQIPAKLS